MANALPSNSLVPNSPITELKSNDKSNDENID